MNAINQDLVVIESQRLPNGLFIAGGGDYDKIWIRDNVYVALAMAEAGRAAEAATIYSGLCQIIAHHPAAFTATTYPKSDSELVHPRFSDRGELITGPWGNKQHDAIGLLLFGIGQVYRLDKKLVSDVERKLAQSLVVYLERCHYWEDPDNGMWEEEPNLHASSLAACIRAIEMVSDFCEYDPAGLNLAKVQLEQLLPKESKKHPTDLALLSLIWPLRYQRRDLLEGVESKLLRDQGVIRYIGDDYEAIGTSEPQWVMGIPWLGIAHYELGDKRRAAEYLELMELLYTDNGLPESYLANNRADIHTPLAWSHALAIVLRSKLTR